MASQEPSQELLDSPLFQITPQFTSAPAGSHSSALPKFPYRPAGSQTGFLRRVGNSIVNPKVPIPRAAHAEAPGKLRARQACSHCREQKAKCTGRQPCQRCEEKGVDCIYGLRSRDVLDRKIAELSAQNQLYRDLVYEIYPGLDISSAQKVQHVFNDLGIEVEPTVYSKARSASPVNSCLRTTTYDTKIGSVDISFTIKGHTDEDFNSSQRLQAMGFIGEHSAIAWLFELTRYLAMKSGLGPGDETYPPSISAMNYFQDEAKLETLEDGFQWTRPPREEADQLVNYYLRTIHPEFPVIGKLTFCWQYQSYFSSPNARPGRRWMALLNLVLAIAAKISPLARTYHGKSTGHHGIYFSRAWQLGIDHVALRDSPDLQQVQVEGLAAFYLLSIAEINRAGRMLGTAIQSAVAMGLHLRNSSIEVQFSTREIRYRVWWTLFVMDSSLQAITGRPPKTDTRFCTTPIPMPYREEDLADNAIRHLHADVYARNQLLRPFLFFTGISDHITGPRLAGGDQIAGSESRKANSDERVTQEVTKYGATTTSATSVTSKTSMTPKISLFFVHTVDLSHLTHKVIGILYSPQPPHISSPDLEITISSFNDSMNQWLLHLPQEFNFTTTHNVRSCSPQTVSLGFRFYAARIVVNKPCLHYLAYDSTRPHPPQSFHQAAAKLCVRAACEMLDLLPSTVDLAWLYGTTPCWLVLHYIMMSITVLMIELFLHSEGQSSEERSVLVQVQKALRWLKFMSNSDTSAKKAWLICNNILAQHESQNSPVHEIQKGQ
ncbi:uncharacterized protein N7496_009110 [Penicillium cataractarum]|uniref:Zn(2)-C6 fungal-type domain-containing protein n=1 Tax=Penicillium cataractarum TaxID=2100454 RepID=A0A9W9RZX1_9EURO|nr:uncharacterized protein N7496_009110 [Penicillium cataractarum]KAJ5369350.1 hypothetical protein N7496_009110 [Penicillium cataractarum]